MRLRGNLVHCLDVHRGLIVIASVLPDQRQVVSGQLLVGRERVEIALQETSAFHEDHRFSLAVEAGVGQGQGVVGSQQIDTAQSALGYI